MILHYNVSEVFDELKVLILSYDKEIGHIVISNKEELGYLLVLSVCFVGHLAREGYVFGVRLVVRYVITNLDDSCLVLLQADLLIDQSVHVISLHSDDCLVQVIEHESDCFVLSGKSTEELVSKGGRVLLLIVYMTQIDVHEVLNGGLYL